MLDVPGASVRDPRSKVLLPATVLCGLTPRGEGTGDVESLFSHFQATCFAHSLAPRQIISHVLPRVEDDLGPMIPYCTHKFGWGWDTGAGMNMLSTRANAERWVRVMEAATGLKCLTGTTMLALKSICMSNMISAHDRICTECTEEDISKSGMPYGRLLWRLSAVTCCPIHRKRLITPKCGGSVLNAYKRVRLSGVCTRCGSIGFRCRSNQAEDATDDEVVRAQRLRRLIASLPAIQAAGPQPVREALRELCKERGAASSLAFRAGIFKSVLSGFLRSTEARIGFDQLLDICAVEGIDVSEFLQGRISPALEGGACHPTRVRRKKPPVDHEAVRAALAEALKAGHSVIDVAKRMRVDIGTLAKHKDLYGLVREATINRRAAAEEARHLHTIKRLEEAALRLKNDGKALTYRNAYGCGSDADRPNSVTFAVVCEMQRALGVRPIRAAANAVALGPRYIQRIRDAAWRVRQSDKLHQLHLPFEEVKAECAANLPP